ncbi:MAG: NAD(+) synthase [Chloroflexi bacterium]|nr:NAD(+) synthase [Chloroflexota bacterium]
MFSTDVLAIDPEKTSLEIEAAIRHQVAQTLRRRGAVLGLSGGVDSSVVCLLCARALGPERVLGLFMPERASASESLELGQLIAETAGVRTELVPIGEILEAAGCYRYQTEAVRRVIPEYDEAWAMKLVLPTLLEGNRLNVFSVVAQAPDGRERRARLPTDAYLQLVAATNMKQRIRKQTEYFFADRLNYAVAGTPNRLEYDQGFFVKNGDGAADFKPIAHLYKTQVYALAEYLGVPKEIRSRPPTTDTYSLPQTQEEFYFALPYDAMDLCLYGRNHDVPVAEVATALGLTPEQIERVYRDIDAKRRATRYLHLPPQLVEPVDEIARETHDAATD